MNMPLIFELVRKALCRKNRSIVMSYKALRRLIGILGIVLPTVLVFGGWFFAGTAAQQSISIYYYTNMRDFFVGLMFVVSLFLITYKGYEAVDFLVTVITGAAGLGLAVFPCWNEAYAAQNVGIFQLPTRISDIVHLSCAGAFFVLLGINSLFLFTRTNSKRKNPRKEKRNRIYESCGIVILLSVAGMLACSIVLTHEQIVSSRIILFIEATALTAFGISWLVKGETAFKDVPKKPVKGTA